MRTSESQSQVVARKNPSRQRCVVAGSAAIALAITAAALVSTWPHLEVAYFLGKLRKDPTLFEEFLFAPEGPRRRAVQRFLRDRAGKERLFRLYVEEYDRTQHSLGVRNFLLREYQNDLAYGTLVLWQQGYACSTTSEDGGRRHSSMGLPALDSERRAMILEHLDACVGETFHMGSFEGFEFQVQALENGYAPEPTWPRVGLKRKRWWRGQESWAERKEPEHVCYFRVMDR